MKIKINTQSGLTSIEAIVVIVIFILCVGICFHCGYQSGTADTIKNLVDQGKLAPVTQTVSPIVTNYNPEVYIKQ